MFNRLTLTPEQTQAQARSMPARPPSRNSVPLSASASSSSLLSVSQSSSTASLQQQQEASSSSDQQQQQQQRVDSTGDHDANEMRYMKHTQQSSRRSRAGQPQSQPQSQPTTASMAGSDRDMSMGSPSNESAASAPTNQKARPVSTGFCRSSRAATIGRAKPPAIGQQTTNQPQERDIVRQNTYDIGMAYRTQQPVSNSSTSGDRRMGSSSSKSGSSSSSKPEQYGTQAGDVFVFFSPAPTYVPTTKSRTQTHAGKKSTR